ncbi:MAG: 2-oxo acid dehydrogenase subunit E2 [Bacteroidetes bacterium]|nr:2-oxo acid dehydrogenase subunit E2 [Bacteroidota bacterium]
MAEYKLLMPKMGESVFEATILSWNKKQGEAIEQDEAILEVATDKVDSDVPSPVGGVLKEILFQEGDTVEVGKVLAIIDTDQAFEQPEIEIEVAPASDSPEEVKESEEEASPEPEAKEEITAEEALESTVQAAIETADPVAGPVADNTSNRYFSPLVLNIAQTEGIPLSELELMKGSGKGGRVTKEDMLTYVKARKAGKVLPVVKARPEASSSATGSKPMTSHLVKGDEIVEMDRMRKLIANHMIDSKKTSAHVSSFVEADLTNVVRWREMHKAAFLKREGFKLSYMPVFVEAIVQSIMEYPMINVSVDGDKIIVKKDINIGIATALPSGNLIVPVIKKAGQLNLVGIARAMNDIVVHARTKALKPDDTMGGTYTISNVGTFGNIMGTPIINQPQVAIMAVGSIVKKPAVVETPDGDMIAVRHKMYLSHTYDHRVVDGMLGGLFVQRVGQILENWDINREL